MRYFHASVDHLTATFRPASTPTGLRTFGRCSSGAIRGTYVAVASFHLERYVDEQAFRFNNRDVGDGIRFQRVLARGRQALTYRISPPKAMRALWGFDGKETRGRC
jgi:hypothetical protein